MQSLSSAARHWVLPEMALFVYPPLSCSGSTSWWIACLIGSGPQIYMRLVLSTLMINSVSAGM